MIRTMTELTPLVGERMRNMNELSAAAGASEPALVSDQARAGLDPAGFDQAQERERKRLLDQAWRVAADGSRTNSITGEKQLPPERAPVQGYARGIPWQMHLDAYDAYSKKWSAQVALIDWNGRGCRGGFGTDELDDFIPGWREKLGIVETLQAEVKRLTAENDRLSKAVTGGILGDLLNADETDALVDFIKYLRAQLQSGPSS